jgi:hypothetical protein
MMTLACLFSLALLGYDNLDSPIEHEQQTLEISFDTNVHVKAEIAYPKLPETSALAKFMNQSLETEALTRYEKYAQEMSVPQEEVDEEDPDRVFRYSFHPIYTSQDLISVYGCHYTYYSMPHGSWVHLGKTYWQRNDSLQELTLDDLLTPSGREWLLHYCLDTFKTQKIGYFSEEDPFWVTLESKDLNTFVLTKQELLLIFQNYVVSGLEDHPISLLIPYSKLADFANPQGPIPFLLKN